MNCRFCGEYVTKDKIEDWIICEGCGRVACMQSGECAHYHELGQIDGYCDDCVDRHSLILNQDIGLPAQVRKL